MRQIAIQSGPWLSLVLAVGGALFYAAVVAEELPPSDSLPEELTEGLAGESTVVRTPVTAKQFVGPQACVECHQEEYLVWSRTNHATNAYDLLRTSSNAKRYAANLGLDQDRVTDDPRCLACHSTPQSEAAESTGLVLGVTCEACHNAAGGESGWLNIHATYGFHGERRESETAEHRRQRIARCRSAGQYRCDDLYSLTKQCYECHVVGDEDLVVRGGHHPGNPGFEMTSWFDERMRHNLCLDPGRNGLAPSLWADPLWRPDRQPGKEINRRRLMYVVSSLVDLEVSLRNRGRAKHSSFASAAATRIVSAYSRLTVISEGGSSNDLEQAVDAIAQLKPILFAPPRQHDSQAFLDAAELIRDIAMRLSAADQGERFSEADRLLGSQTKRRRPTVDGR